MKIKFLPRESDKTYVARLPYDHATYVVVDDFTCPECAASPISISGRNQHYASHDTYGAAAHCTSCKARVGNLFTTVSTVFGIEEDERVLGGPWKVY